MADSRRERMTSWPTRIAAAITMAATALGSLWMIASARDRAEARPERLTPQIARLTDVPSHGHSYRASLIPSPGPIERGRPLTWTLDIRDSTRRPVSAAALALENWMPDDESIPTTRPRARPALGAGRYRVDNLHFDRRGWWNLKLEISAAGVTDSLAINHVLR